jgi:hypothetical protein
MFLSIRVATYQRLIYGPATTKTAHTVPIRMMSRHFYDAFVAKKVMKTTTNLK